MNGSDLVSYFQAAQSGVSLFRALFPGNKGSDRPPPPPNHSEDLRRLREELRAAEPSSAAQRVPALSTPTPTTPSPIESPTLPTTEETLQELRRDLGKELYRVERDLQRGARIAGKPCDCLTAKHNFGLESTTEELMSYEANPVYGEIVLWFQAHEAEFEPHEIARRPPQHYQALAPQVREFRKRVMGTTDRAPLLTAEQMARVRERVQGRRRRLLGQEFHSVATETPAMRQRARELAQRVRAGEISRNEAVAALADDLVNEGKKPPVEGDR